MKIIWIWLEAKLGRLISGIGILLSAVEGFDISEIKQPLEELIGHVWVLRITVGLFLASYLRHQVVADRHPKS